MERWPETPIMQTVAGSAERSPPFGATHVTGRSTEEGARVV